MASDPLLLELLDHLIDVNDVVSDLEILVALPLGHPQVELNLPLPIYSRDVEIETASCNGQHGQLADCRETCFNRNTVLVELLLSCIPYKVPL